MIGERIRKIREDKGMSLTQLAQQAKISKSYLSEIERDREANPSVRYLERIASVLGVDVETLIENKRSEDKVDGNWNSLVEEAVKQGITKQQFKKLIEFLTKLKE